jgi:hypothetical protein
MSRNRSIRATLESLHSSADLPTQPPGWGWPWNHLRRPRVLVACGLLGLALILLGLAEAPRLRSRIYLDLGLHHLAWQSALEVDRERERRELLARIYRAVAAQDVADVTQRLQGRQGPSRREPWWVAEGSAALAADELLTEWEELLAEPPGPRREAGVIELLERVVGQERGEAVTFWDLYPWGRRTGWPGEPFWVREGPVVRKRWLAVQRAWSGGGAASQLPLARRLLAGVDSSRASGGERTVWRAICDGAPAEQLAGVSGDWWLQVWLEALTIPDQVEREELLERLVMLRVMCPGQVRRTLYQARLRALAGAPGQPDWLLMGPEGLAVSRFLAEAGEWPAGCVEGQMSPDPLWDRTMRRVRVEVSLALQQARDRDAYRRLLLLGEAPGSAVTGTIVAEVEQLLDRLPASPNREHRALLITLAALELAGRQEARSNHRLWRSRAMVLRAGHSPVLYEQATATCCYCPKVTLPRTPTDWLGTRPVFACNQPAPGRRGSTTALDQRLPAWSPWRQVAPRGPEVLALLEQVGDWPWGICASRLDDTDRARVALRAGREASRWIPVGPVGGIPSLERLIWHRAGQEATRPGVSRSSLDPKLALQVLQLAGVGALALERGSVGGAGVLPPELELLWGYRLGHLPVLDRNKRALCAVCGAITGPAAGVVENAAGSLTWRRPDGTVVVVPPPETGWSWSRPEQPRPAMPRLETTAW